MRGEILGLPLPLEVSFFKSKKSFYPAFFLPYSWEPVSISPQAPSSIFEKNKAFFFPNSFFFDL